MGFLKYPPMPGVLSTVLNVKSRRRRGKNCKIVWEEKQRGGGERKMKGGNV
jgi:hypothetical protein